MIKFLFRSLIFCGFVLIISNCVKESDQVRILQTGCLPELFSVPSWYTDSIFYLDNQINRIDKSYRNNSDKNTQARFEYNDNEVKIFVRDLSEGVWRDFLNYSLTFGDGKILQIDTNSDRVQANYFYDSNHLKYILYHFHGRLSDSISVEYEGDEKNITHAEWYKFNPSSGNYQLKNSAVFTYDDKSNPHKNSIHFLYDFYDCEEFSLDYFNTNNIKTIHSTISDIHTEYTYNEFGFPVYIIFYNGQSEETDRNSFYYNCK